MQTGRLLEYSIRSLERFIFMVGEDKSFLIINTDTV